MLALLFVLAVALITVVGAELVRSSCQRLLRQPVRRSVNSELAAAE